MMTSRGTNRFPLGAPTAVQLASLLVASLLLAVPATAVDDGGGRSVFAAGAGNRALALGGAYVAVADDASAAVWNPAGLARNHRKQLQATQTSLLGLGFSEQYAALVYPHWRWGAAAIAYRRFGVDGIEGRDDRGFLYADDLQDTETEVSLGYAYRLAGGDLALGGAVKVQSQSLAGYSATGLGADLGLWSRPLALVGAAGAGRNLAFGLSLRNAVEPELKLDQDAVPDPLTVRTGLAWEQPLGEGLALLLTGDLEQSRGMDARTHLGLEWRLHDTLALRAGSDDGTFTAGAGLAWRGLGADYQYEGNPLDDIHRFGVSVRFGPTTGESQRAARDAAEAALQARLETAFAARLDAHAGEVARGVRDALDRGAWREALDGVGTLAVLAPTHPELTTLEAAGWVGLAGDQERDEDYATAAVSFRRALALVPDHDVASSGLARVQTASDRRATRGRELRDRFDAALAAFAGGELLVARDGFATVLELAPDDQDAARMLERTRSAITRRAASLADEAVTLAGADRLDAARQRLAAARELAADAPGVAAAASAVRLAARRAEQAAAAAAPTPRTRPVATSPTPATDPPDDPSPERRRELEAFYRRGLTAMEAGRRDEAVRYWEIVWTADSDHAQVREHLAQEYLARGMEAYASGALHDAIDSWEQAQRVAPDDSRARGYLDRARQQLDRMEMISSSR